jgi:hypothetical protein
MPAWAALIASAATATLLRGIALISGYQLPAWNPGPRQE